MNSENFSDYVKEVSNLYKISYQELKSLVLQYPYCQNLHVLLLLKSKMEQHKDFEKNLERAAAYSLDRKHLLKQLQEIEVTALESEHLILREDYLELKDLSEVEETEKIEVSPPQEETLETITPDFLTSKLQQSPEREEIVDSNPFLNSSGKDYEDINLSDALINDLIQPSPQDDTTKHAGINGKEVHPIEEEQGEEEPLPQEAPAPNVEAEVEKPEESTPVENIAIEESTPNKGFSIPTDIIKSAAVLSGIVPTLQFEQQTPAQTEAVPEVASDEAVSSVPKAAVRPIPKSSFNSWSKKNRTPLADIDLPKQSKSIASKKKKKKKKKISKDSALWVAENSVIDHGEIASETLAELFVSQQQMEKAITIYKRLKKLYPERKAYFNKKIKELSHSA